MISIHNFIPEHTSALETAIRMNTPRYFAEYEVTDYLAYLIEYPEPYFVAIENDQVIGGAGYLLSASGKEINLTWGFVHPDWHGKGAGSALLRHRILHSRQQLGEIPVLVQTSQLSWTFFLMHGFRLMSIERNHWMEGLDKYEMILDL